MTAEKMINAEQQNSTKYCHFKVLVLVSAILLAMVLILVLVSAILLAMVLILVLVSAILLAMVLILSLIHI